MELMRERGLSEDDVEHRNRWKLGRETVEGNILVEEGTCLKFMTGSLCSYNMLFLRILYEAYLVIILRAVAENSIIFRIILNGVTTLHPIHLFPSIIKQIFTGVLKYSLFIREATGKL
jgi:hypothetical protein